MSLNNIFKQISLTRGIGDILAVSAGFAKGYCNAQGIEIDNSLLNNGLTFIPLVLQTGAGAYTGLSEGITDDVDQKYSPLAINGGLLGLGLGALEIGLGYYIGYASSFLMDKL